MLHPTFTRPRPTWWPSPREREALARLARFLAVGGAGVLVNSLALFVLYQQARLPLLAASALAVELAIVSNFVWNDVWTFRRKGLSLSRFARFNLVSLGGLVLTTLTLWLLAGHAGVPYLGANLVGIALATGWNFAANTTWTWS